MVGHVWLDTNFVIKLGLVQDTTDNKHSRENSAHIGTQSTEETTSGLPTYSEQGLQTGDKEGDKDI